MSKPIPFDYRLKIIGDRENSMTYSAIATKWGVSIRSVKTLWKRYQTNGKAGLQTNYANCGRKPIYSQELKDLINTERKKFGAPSLKDILEEKYPDKKIPHERQIQLWWKEQGTNKPKKKEGESEVTLAGQKRFIILGR